MADTNGKRHHIHWYLAMCDVRFAWAALFVVSMASMSAAQTTATAPAATAATPSTRFSGPQTIHPGELWPDNRGEHIQAHGGGIIRLADDTLGAPGPDGAAGFTYYWFGEERSRTLPRE